MSPKETIQIAKIGALLLACFVGGGFLIYNGVAEKKGPIELDDVLPGLSAIAAGVVLIGLFYFLSRPIGSAAGDTGDQSDPPAA